VNEYTGTGQRGIHLTSEIPFRKLFRLWPLANTRDTPNRSSRSGSRHGCDRLQEVGIRGIGIEQGGSSLYPAMALRATSVEVLRILTSTGPTETMHVQPGWTKRETRRYPPCKGVERQIPWNNSQGFWNILGTKPSVLGVIFSAFQN